MTSRTRRKRRENSVLFLSILTGLSISNALVSLSNDNICPRWLLSSELRPAATRLFPCKSRLYSILGIDNNSIIDRQGFLVDSFCSMTSSSIAISSTTEPATTAKDAESICQNGALIGELAVPGAYSSTCMGLSERIVPLPRYQERMTAMNRKMKSADIQRNEKNLQQSGTITVEQKAGGSGNTGMTVWNSGLLLTRLLDEMVDELQRQQLQKGGESSDNAFWINQDVIELGCGTGLCSIAAHRLGANSVVATDGNPRVLQLAEANIRQNCYENTDSDGSKITDPALTSEVSRRSPSTIRAESLQWGFLNAMDYSESASFVIGADLTYNPGSWDALAETIATVLKTENDNVSSGNGATPISNQCYALYLSVGHDGFNVNAEVDGFLSVAKEKGLISIDDGVEGIDLNELLRRTLSDAEKKIISQGGGFRVVVLGRKTAKRR